MPEADQPWVAAELPKPVPFEISAPGIGDYWHRRAEQHTGDSYMGVRMSKFPEDLRVYEHLLWLMKPDVVIELGVQWGGSTLWFRDRLAAIARYTGRPGSVVAVEINAEPARQAITEIDPSFEQITLLEGDVLDPGLAAEVGRYVPEGARCLVIEDTAHVYDTTLAALQGFNHFVPPDGFFIVEDGCVDIEELRLSPEWPRGVLPAVNDWLATEDGSRFTVRRDLELYGMTCHPSGFLQRR